MEAPTKNEPFLPSEEGSERGLPKKTKEIYYIKKIGRAYQSSSAPTLKSRMTGVGGDATKGPNGAREESELCIRLTSRASDIE